MFGRSLFLSVSVLLGVLSLVSCQRNQSEKVAVKAETGIFSDRWITRTKVVLVVKLKEPSLIELAKQVGGKWAVDPKILQAYEEAQQKAIDSVLNLHPDIKLVYRYKWVLNGFAVVVPVTVADRLQAIGGVEATAQDIPLEMPKPLSPSIITTASVTDRNPVKFIGAEKVHEMTITTEDGKKVKLDGSGIRVGVIDTGVDFTHSMLGGEGTVDAYKAVDSAKATPAFPNKKVVAGIDLVGTAYNAASMSEDRGVPTPDSNPLDEAGHGSHVAGTIAGIGDGKTSYSGVAPGAVIHAIRVFGAEGSTALSAILAGFEYSADPDFNNDISDRLDVVNLSLGSPYGLSRRFEGAAIKNLTRIGSIVVNSAGNEGDNTYIVGGMSAVDEALSVAASIDDSDHNTLYPAVVFSGPQLGRQVAERIEGSISKLVDDAGPVSGKLVDVGLAITEITGTLAVALKGNVALVERGQATFLVKAQNAFNAGAIGVVIVNNVDGDPIAPGGSGRVDIPVVAIKKELGQTIREKMKLEDVSIEFSAPEKIQRLDRVDAITGFSSRGPRSYDGHLKPDIAAPGEAIVSAASGEGSKVVKMSGTSMAAPMMSGAMAIMRQAFPQLSVAEIKNIVMGTAKPLNVPLARQGAGRIQLEDAVNSTLVANRPSISFGNVQLNAQKQILEKISFKSLVDAKARKPFELKWDKMHPGFGLTISGPKAISADEMEFELTFQLNAAKMKTPLEEMEGRLHVVSEGKVIYRIPVLALARRISRVQVDSLVVAADSAEGSEDAITTVQLSNPGVNEGPAYLFNTIALDARKKNPNGDLMSVNACDLQGAGYRIVHKEINGLKVPVLQIAAKIFEPVMSFNHCELSVLFGEGKEGDMTANQELARVPFKRISGLDGPTTMGKFGSILMDARIMREIRKASELAAKNGEPESEPSYASAVLSALPSPLAYQTTVQIVEAPISLLTRSQTGDLSIRIATLQEEEDTTEADDFLSGSGAKWFRISSDERAQSFMGLPEELSLKPAESRTVTLKKGFNKHSLMVLFPQNAGILSTLGVDQQMTIIDPKYQTPQL